MVPVCTSSSWTTAWYWSQEKSACALSNLAAAAFSWVMTFCRSALLAGDAVWAGERTGSKNSNPRQNREIIFFASTMDLLTGCWTTGNLLRVFFICIVGQILAMSPDSILGHVAAGVFLLAIAVNCHVAGDGLNALQQLCLQLDVVAGIGQLVGANLVGPGIWPIGSHQDVLSGSEGFLRPVAVVDQPRRDEEEKKDKGHHHVVMKTASRLGPEQIAFYDSLHIFTSGLLLRRPYTAGVPLAPALNRRLVDNSPGWPARCARLPGHCR